MHEHHHEINDTEQAKTLLEYMYNHNVSHAAELTKIAEKLRECGMNEAAGDVDKALAEYTKGNDLLASALSKAGD